MALFSLCGGHWAIMQSIAWANMIRTYSSEGSFESAVEKTFSGKHRCSLCKKIEQAKQKEKKNSFVTESFKKKEGILEKLSLSPKFFPKNFNYALQSRRDEDYRVVEPLLQPPRKLS